MFNFVPVSKEEDLVDVSCHVANDEEALKWIAFYGNSKNWWHTLTSANRYSAVAFDELGNLVGFFDYETDADVRSSAIVYYLIPELRGQKLGGEFIKEALIWMKAAHPSISVAFAYIDENNIGSRRAIDVAGFRYETTRKQVMYYVRILH